MAGPAKVNWTASRLAKKKSEFEQGVYSVVTSYADLAILLDLTSYYYKSVFLSLQI